MEQLEGIDRAVFLFINGMHSPLFDTVMWYISTIILWIPLFIFFFYYAFKKGKWPLVLITLVAISLCILLADRISVVAFKEVFQRYRPSHNIDLKDLVHTVQKPNGDIYFGGLYGFLSSHAANFFAISTLLVALFSRFSKQWYWLFLWASLIAYSRIYLGVHYPSDITAGALLGIVIGIFVYSLTKPILRKYGLIKT